MRIVGMMLTRNEDWIIRPSLEAALRWCDGMVVVMDRCTDGTPILVDAMLKKRGKPAMLKRVDDDTGKWDEMDLRQLMLDRARELKGTHYAIIDSDEIVTHNYLPFMRSWFERLKPGEVLDLPMIPVWDNPNMRRVGDNTWSTAWLTLGFMDQADPKAMGWKAAADGYHHHNRPPFGATGRKRLGSHDVGGVMHLQFANPRRLLAKHVLYRMVDHLRWPGRESVEQLNWKYDQALKPGGRLEAIPKEWWGDYYKDFIYPDDVPYQEAEIARLLKEHGREKFAGLDLKGF